MSTTASQIEPNPVRCGSCGWEGDATELLDEGHCPRGCHAASVVPVDDPDKRFTECPECGGDDFELIRSQHGPLWFCIHCSTHFDADGEQSGEPDEVQG